MTAAKTNHDRILAVFFGPSPAISLGMQIVNDKLTVRVVGIVEGLGPGPRPGKVIGCRPSFWKHQSSDAPFSACNSSQMTLLWLFLGRANVNV